jgi:glycosyltransferase involved in cell wall biosynthesis
VHIAFVTPTFPPENGWGGIGTYVYHTSSMLAMGGFEVSVLCGIGQSRSDSNRGGVRVCRWLDADRSDVLGFSAQVADALDQLISERPVDIVEFPEYAAPGICFQRRNPHFPVVVRLHGDTNLCWRANAPCWKRKAMAVFRHGDETCRLERESTFRAQAVSAPSKWSIGNCLRRGWAFAQPPVTYANPYQMRNCGLSRTAQPSAPTVVHLARLDYLKGAPLLPAILSRVLDAIPEVQFELIGQDGGRRNHLWKEWIQSRIPLRYHNRVLFAGGIPYEQVPDRVSRHSVAFFASAWETFSYTLAECMSEGLACVNGSRGGSHEVGIDNHSVLNVDRKPSAIAGAIIRLLTDEALRTRISMNGPARVAELCGHTALIRHATLTYISARERAGAAQKPCPVVVE